MQTAIVIDDTVSEGDEVAINKPVDVYFPDDDETETFRLVTTIRGNSLKGLISIDSPIGKAIIGHHEGETVHVAINENMGYDVVIKKVYAAADDSEDTIKGF